MGRGIATISLYEGMKALYYSRAGCPELTECEELRSSHKFSINWIK
jgi:hypothetical protein